MKRSIYLVIEIALLVVVLQSSFVQYYLSDLQDSLAQWMLDISRIPEKQELSKFKQVVVPNMRGLNDTQKEYLETLTESQENLTKFYRMYCINDDKNPYIYGVNLRFLCQQIQVSGFNQV